MTAEVSNRWKVMAEAPAAQAQLNLFWLNSNVKPSLLSCRVVPLPELLHETKNASCQSSC